MWTARRSPAQSAELYQTFPLNQHYQRFPDRHSDHPPALARPMPGKLPAQTMGGMSDPARPKCVVWLAVWIFSGFENRGNRWDRIHFLTPFPLRSRAINSKISRNRSLRFVDNRCMKAVDTFLTECRLGFLNESDDSNAVSRRPNSAVRIPPYAICSRLFEILLFRSQANGFSRFEKPHPDVHDAA